MQDLKAMTIAQTERPSYRSKKRYAKFGALQANMNLEMHEKLRPKNRYEFRKVNQNDMDEEQPEQRPDESTSLVRISKMKQNLKKKKEIRERMAVDDGERNPIQIMKSKKVIQSKKGGTFPTNQYREMKLMKNNKVRELLRDEEVAGSG